MGKHQIRQKARHPISTHIYLTKSWSLSHALYPRLCPYTLLRHLNELQYLQEVACCRCMFLGKPHVASLHFQPTRHTQANLRSFDQQQHYTYLCLELHINLVPPSIQQPERWIVRAVFEFRFSDHPLLVIGHVSRSSQLFDAWLPTHMQQISMPLTGQHARDNGPPRKL